MCVTFRDAPVLMTPLLSMSDGEGLSDRLLVLAQKISCWLIESILLGEAEIAIRLDIKSASVIMGF